MFRFPPAGVPQLPLLVLTLLLCISCGGSQEGPAESRSTAASDRIDINAATWLVNPSLSSEVARLELVAALSVKPSGVVQEGERIFVAVPRWNGAQGTLFELVDGELQPWPDATANDASDPDGLRSVNGLRSDDRGRLWVLDNGRVQLQPAAPGTPKVVVYDMTGGEELFRHVFPEDVAPAATSFLNDLAIDAGRGFAYILETGMGGPGALLTFEIAADRSRRLLHGHESVVPDADEVMAIGGEVATIRLEGSDRPWRVGANPIALSPDGETLFWGPMTSRELYRAPTRVLRDVELEEEAIASEVSPWAHKPISDGMDISPAGLALVTDVENDGIARVSAGRAPELLVADPAFRFPVVVDFIDAGTFLFSSNQLHLHPLLHGGEGRSRPPFFIWRVHLHEGAGTSDQE